MSIVRTSSRRLPVLAKPAALVRTERGRTLILWGWLATMVGVGCYCRAVFSLGPDAEALDALTRSGLLGWMSLLLGVGGVFLWFMGNLLYLHDAMDTPDPAATGTGELSGPGPAP